MSQLRLAAVVIVDLPVSQGIARLDLPAIAVE